MPTGERALLKEPPETPKDETSKSHSTEGGSVDEPEEGDNITKEVVEASPSKPPVKVTYPNPKSFAERLMKALESDVAPNCLWWVGEGKGVALHTKSLKEANVLSTHFNVFLYSGFIRNLNR